MPSKNYVLIDFENIQPKNLEILKKYPFNVFVFVGGNQVRLPFEMACTLQEFGKKVRYIKMSGSGRNALDFHIACYLGHLSAEDKNGNYYIVSKDTGFDPLVKHLKSKKIRVSRVSDPTEISTLQISNIMDSDNKINTIVKNLAGRGQTRPRKIKTLSNTINSLFAKKLEENELTSIINNLKTKKYITVNQNNVSYNLPKNL
jgi:hypothetical protein